MTAMLTADRKAPSRLTALTKDYSHKALKELVNGDEGLWSGQAFQAQAGCTPERLSVARQRHSLFRRVEWRRPRP